MINFGRNFVIFVKNLLTWGLLLFLYLFFCKCPSLKHPVQKSSYPKLFFLNRRPGRLIGHLRWPSRLVKQDFEYPFIQRTFTNATPSDTILLMTFMKSSLIETWIYIYIHNLRLARWFLLTLKYKTLAQVRHYRLCS